MTRWYVLHDTQNVTLARNVGYLSIGQGYYLEDANEVNNNLYSNVGIFARAAVENAQNPRKIPGLMARPIENRDDNSDVFPFHSDWDHPTVFWITNGWNDLEGNLAAGAGTCGACYWFIPAANHDNSQAWKGYASLQAAPGGFGDVERAATSPIKEFYGNSCSTAMISLMTVGATAPCLGVEKSLNKESPNQKDVPPLDNVLAPPVTEHRTAEYKMYYPNTSISGFRVATKCPDQTKDCSTEKLCANDGPDENHCMVNVINNYTSSFNWSPNNFSAIWLRQNFFLFLNSIVTDVQQGGLTFVTGGDETRSSAAEGEWELAKGNVFIGATQPSNPYASEMGPFVPTGLTCDDPNIANPRSNKNEGTSFPLDNFSVGQRFFNIYDGPNYEDSNAFLDINKSVLDGCKAGSDFLDPSCFQKYMYARPLGVLKDATQSDVTKQCYTPNAGIAWKQPNGFYYPPAFHSTNLFFDNTDIRHFVVEPLFQLGTYLSDNTAQA